jgi:hypothetical protein
MLRFATWQKKAKQEKESIREGSDIVFASILYRDAKKKIERILSQIKKYETVLLMQLCVNSCHG